MRQISLTEYRTTFGVELTPDECATLQRLAPSILISPSSTAPGTFDLTAGHFVGAVRLPALSITIHPKINVRSVLFLIAYALDPKRWDKSGFDLTRGEDLSEAIVPAFVFALETATGRGLYRSYRSKEDTDVTLRGRLRIEDQIRRRFSLWPPVEVRYDEFTEDVEENRLLKAALWRLQRLFMRSGDARLALRRFEGLLDRARRVALRPDLSWWDGAECRFVGDAKYKRVVGGSVDNADLYQMLAYTIATRLPCGLLIYAAGECEGVTHYLSHADKRIEVVELDLDGAPEQILSRVDVLAQRISTLRAEAEIPATASLV